MDILPPTDENLRRAADALRSGQVIAYPTETVYGVGVDPFNADALGRLYAIKKRDPQNPVLLIVGSRDQLARLAAPMTPVAAVYADTFWPGPLSLLLRPAVGIPRTLCGPKGKICVRWTSCAIAAALCTAFGGAIVSSSANLSGEPPARRAREVPGTGVAMCIDGGELREGPPSTVFDPETGEVIREGAVSSERIAKVRTG